MAKSAFILVLFILLVIITSSVCGFGFSEDEGEFKIDATYSFNLINNSRYRLELDRFVSGNGSVNTPTINPSSTEIMRLTGQTNLTTATVAYSVLNASSSVIVDQIQFTLEYQIKGAFGDRIILRSRSSTSTNGLIFGDGCNCNRLTFKNA